MNATCITTLFAPRLFALSQLREADARSNTRHGSETCEVSFEFFQTPFFYIEKDTGSERYVGVPEEEGRNVISSDPLEPDSVYAASVDDQGKVGLYRLEVGCASGTGKLSSPL